MNSLIEFANIALLLGIVVAAIATIQWQAGVITSVVAAFGLNYYGVEPTHSLRITSRDDIFTIVLLLALGLTVSGLTAYRIRSTILNSHEADSVRLRNQLVRDTSSPINASDVWADVQSIIFHELDLLKVHVVHDLPSGIPQIASRLNSTDDSLSTVVIPATGAFLTFNDPRITKKLIVIPKDGVGSVTLRRDVLFLFARHLEAHREGILIS